jgi:hypothetical protein
VRDFIFGFVEFGLSLWPTIYLKSRKKTIGTISRFIKCFLKFTSKEMHYFFYRFSYHPLINPRVNPADILPVNGIPKIPIVNEEAAAAACPSLLLLICIIAFESVVITPSDTVLKFIPVYVGYLMIL